MAQGCTGSQVWSWMYTFYGGKLQLKLSLKNFKSTIASDTENNPDDGTVCMCRVPETIRIVV